MKVTEEIIIVDSIYKGINYIISLQKEKQWWEFGLEGESRPISHLLIMLNLTNQRYEKLISSLIFKLKNLQNLDGSWSLYKGGSSHLPTTVEAYLSLRLNGVSVDDPVLRRSRNFIQKNGGVKAVKGPTKILLAILQLLHWSNVLLPPLSILTVKEELSSVFFKGEVISLLHLIPSIILKYCNFTIDYPLKQSLMAELGGVYSQSTLNNLLSIPQKLLTPEKLIAKATTIIKGYQNSDGSIGGILTATELTWLMAKALKLDSSDPLIAGTERALVKFALNFKDSKDKIIVINTPTRDTIYITNALITTKRVLENRVEKRFKERLVDTISNSLEWLRTQRVIMNPGCGWNYCGVGLNIADIDDTGTLISAILNEDELDPIWEELKKEAIDWMLSMRRRDGGFALMSMSKTLSFLKYKLVPSIGFYEKIPYITESSSIDATFHIINILKGLLISPHYKSYLWNYFYDGLRYIIRRQNPKGFWLSKLNSGFIHGTSLGVQALSSLKSGGKIKEVLRKGVVWLEACQNRDGGWGEDPISVERQKFVSSKSSYIWHTSTATLGLLSYYNKKEAIPENLKKAIRFILDGQNTDGSWNEELPSGITIPGFIHLYHTAETLSITIKALLRYYEIVYS